MPTGMGSYAGTSSTHSGSVQAPGIVLSVPSLEVNEGGQATYTVSLETQPSGNVSVAIAGADLSPDAPDFELHVDDLVDSADRDAVSRHRPQRNRFQHHGDPHGRRGRLRLAHLSRNEPPPAPPPNPRTPESSPPSPGGSSSASNRRASRLSAGTALSRAGSAACYAAPHDGRRPGRGQEGAGCQRRFPVITARSMECASEPGVIAARLPAASFAGRGRGGADRSHRAVPSLRRPLRSLGRHALGSVLAGLAVLVIGAPEQANAQTPNTPATGAPTITGTAQVGQTLTAVTTGITDADGLTTPNYTYQWIRVDGTDEEDISGENSSTYTLDDADLGKTIKVKVSFDDDASNTETLTSAATVTVTAATTPNTAPTAANKTVTTGEDRAYAFTADDFGFDDADAGATLASVTIVTPPMAGHAGARLHGGHGGRRRHQGPDRRRHAHLHARARCARRPLYDLHLHGERRHGRQRHRLHDDHRRDGHPRPRLRGAQISQATAGARSGPAR